VRTDQLIQAMAADAERSRPVGALLPVAVLVVAAVMGGLFLAAAGTRPDLGEALMQLRVIVKQTFPVLLALGALGAALRLARPGAPVGRWALALAAVPLLLLGAVAVELMVLPAAGWEAAMIGHYSIGECFGFITVLSLPVLAASLWVLRRGASTRPGLTGAVAGLMSGAAVAALYAFYCTEDSPLFYAVWYVLAILVVAGLGALLGRRVLRW
jgi:hypothetical protein